MREIEIDKVYIDGAEYDFYFDVPPPEEPIDEGDIQTITLDSLAPDSGKLVIVTKRGNSYETYYEIK
jgi:hypothetical protein